MHVVDTSHVGLHLSRGHVHADESRAQEAFVVSYAVHGCHHGVDISVVGEHRHLRGRVKGLADGLLAGTGLLHHHIALSLAHSPLKVLLDALCGHCGAVGCVLMPLALALKDGLQIVTHVLAHSFLGIALHAAVDGCVNLQAVGIYIIVGAVLLLVLVAPAEERVCFPCQRILKELLSLPRGIVAAHRFLGHHHGTQIFAHVGTLAHLVVHAVEVQRHGFLLQALALVLLQISSLHHLPQHDVAALLCEFGMTHRVVVRRVLAHAHQHGALVDGQVLGLLAEICLCCRLEAHGIVQEVEVVEVHRDDLLLGVVAFELHGNHPLNGFLQQAFLHAAGLG